MKLPRILVTLLFAVLIVVPAPARAQEHAAPPPAQEQSPLPKGAEPIHPTGVVAEGEHAEGNVVVETIARLLNFALLAGALVYFLRTPIADYLTSRGTQIRQDLVTASEMRAAASAQLADIERKMQALPAELEALRKQGAEDVKAEQARIARAAEVEQARLLDQTRREIEMRLRVARRELTEHAAQLAVQVAEQRIRASITPDDQLRLLDRYASQLREAR
jgi:F-type H+-transporting ATPase subunit b